MKTVIIAANLINDYCGSNARFQNKIVHISPHEVDRIFGDGKSLGQGPLPLFLQNESEKKDTFIMYLRDFYQADNPKHDVFLEKYGDHCLENTPGIDPPSFMMPAMEAVEFLNCSSLVPPFDVFEAFVKKTAQVNSFSLSEPSSEKVRFLLVGFHTERRIYSIAHLLHNVYGISDVAVFKHFLSSSNKESHFTALRNQFPEGFIRVINGLTELGDYLNSDLTYLNEFNLGALQIFPESIRDALSLEQTKIVESICMHWTEAELKPLGGGFSGSALFIAHGKQGVSNTEPMVIKIDDHYPIQLEVKGYNIVKDFLGKHVPTFTLPVSYGKRTGVGMELAAMEGAPDTLEQQLQNVDNDYKLDAFINRFERTLDLLTHRVYNNTKSKKRIAPFRHFSLHVTQQANWLEANIENINRHTTDQILVSGPIILNIFNVVRFNSDAIVDDVCVGHGDLNLANIIVDEQDNLWTIDWTHTGSHPVATDFAKMENDIKFVLTKDIQYEDLNKLQSLEEYLLKNLALAPIAELPEHLNFIKWDLRFKKIYLPLFILRNYYCSIVDNSEWLVYKIALLRYGLHTLSFDKSTGGGVCSPPQLWYALMSMESLLFELVADDYHLRIRSERPDHYPERYRIQLDLANWKVPCPDYRPPYYVSDAVLEQERGKTEGGIADTEGVWEHKEFVPWGGEHTIADDGKPQNPRGRTGIAGRGDLYLWGRNPMIYLLPIRFNTVLQQLEFYSGPKEDSDIVSSHLRRGETSDQALARAKDKLFSIPDKTIVQKVHEGYLYDPRQTDHAWIESRSYIVFLPTKSFENENMSANGWKIMSSDFINASYSSYSYLMRKALGYMLETQLADENIIRNLMDKTG